MFRSFREIERYIQKSGKKKVVALAGAHDSIALEAVVSSKRRGLISAVLIGNLPEIQKLLIEMNEPVRDYTLISCEGELECAQSAVSLVIEGGADIPMKGLMQTSSFMRAVLHKTDGLLPDGALLSEATVFRYPGLNKLMIATDCAINISPTQEDKVKITENAARLAHVLGVPCPKVAVISAKEEVTPKIASTVEADALAKLEWENCIVDGPFALDNALSKEASEHKGIRSSVAGDADILLMPDLCSGNVLHKSLHYFAGIQTAGALCGTASPVIMTSRTDSADTKYHSILISLLQA